MVWVSNRLLIETCAWLHLLRILPFVPLIISFQGPSLSSEVSSLRSISSLEHSHCQLPLVSGGWGGGGTGGRTDTENEIVEERGKLSKTEHGGTEGNKIHSCNCSKVNQLLSLPHLLLSQSTLMFPCSLVTSNTRLWHCCCGCTVETNA